MTKRMFSIDEIIRKWFPVLGIFCIASGLSYLFYDGLWGHMGPTGRVVLGFIAGVGMIAGGFVFEKKLKYFSDVIVGGGILLLYITLIYGSRLEGAKEATALIPESLTLVIATLFAAGVAFFSLKQQSKTILAIGILGGYATPFFMMQADTYSAQVELWGYLSYFIAINVIVLLVVQKFFFKGIGLLNAVGLFVGTIALAIISGEHFSEYPKFASAFVVLVLALHVLATAMNAKKHVSENDPFLFAGYILPLLWYIGIVEMDLVNAEQVGILVHTLLFVVASAIYFGVWYYLRSETHSGKHYGVYIGGITSLVYAVFAFSPTIQEYNGLFLGILSLVFAVLYLMEQLPQRQMSYLGFAMIGFLITMGNAADGKYSGELLFLDMENVFLIASLVPFLASFFFPVPKEERPVDLSERILRIVALTFIGLLVLDDVLEKGNFFLIFGTIPAAVLALIVFLERDPSKKLGMIPWATGLGLLGFFETFFLMVDRIYPVPTNLLAFQTTEALIGFLSIAIFAILMQQVRSVRERVGEGSLFMVVFSFYIILFLTVTHEILLGFNYLDVVSLDETAHGFRAGFVTLWWILLSCFMILFGVKKESFLSEKNLGFTLFLFTILKIIFYDLANVDKNVKVLLFIIIGCLILGVSYVAHKSDADNLSLKNKS